MKDTKQLREDLTASVYGQSSSLHHRAPQREPEGLPQLRRWSGEVCETKSGQFSQDRWSEKGDLHKEIQTEICRRSYSSLQLSTDQCICISSNQGRRKNHPNGSEGSIPCTQTGLEIDTSLISHNRNSEKNHRAQKHLNK